MARTFAHYLVVILCNCTLIRDGEFAVVVVVVFDGVAHAYDQ